jgi:Xaa-Pro aminopeptidase
VKVLGALLAGLLLLPLPAARASELTDDLAARRGRVMDRLGPDALLILESAPLLPHSRDVDYEYRQDPNFYYLTALTQPGSVLVLMPGNTTRREILFVTPRDPVDEHWNGVRLDRDEAAAQTGIATVLTTTEFEPFIDAILSAQPAGGITAADARRFFDALGNGNARVALTLEPPSLDAPPGRIRAFANRLRDRFAGFDIIDAAPIFAALRLLKTPYEQQLLVRSGRISSDAQLAGLRAARPGGHEYEVKAAIEASQRAAGATWAYPSIVGSGPNATILHYPGSARQMAEGDLLLADAGASFEYLATDVTRTYPVSGRFTEAQKDIYTVVLRAQEAAAQVAVPGALPAQIYNKTVEIIRDGLLQLGLITDPRGDQYRMWYTHGSTHYIGIDVHDVGDLNHPLEPGMAFTIEPGIYIRQRVLDDLPRTADNLALIERIAPAVRKYDGIGVRIEDSFLLDATGTHNLTAWVPKRIEEIERLLAGSR